MSTVPFDQLNASLFIKSIHLFPIFFLLLNGSVRYDRCQLLSILRWEIVNAKHQGMRGNKIESSHFKHLFYRYHLLIQSLPHTAPYKSPGFSLFAIASWINSFKNRHKKTLEPFDKKRHTNINREQNYNDKRNKQANIILICLWKGFWQVQRPLV